MKDNRWTVRSTEWQKTKLVRPKCRRRDDIAEQQEATWKRAEEVGVTLAEGYFLQWKDTA